MEFGENVMFESGVTCSHSHDSHLFFSLTPVKWVLAFILLGFNYWPQKS